MKGMLAAAETPVPAHAIEVPVTDARAIEAQAYALGFDLVGITTLGPAATAPAFDAWVASQPKGSTAP